MTQKKPRILLSIWETAGYFTNLERGFLELGYQAKTAFVRHHPFGYKTEKNIPLLQKLLLWNSKALFANISIIFRIPFFIFYRFFLLPLFFIQCLFTYDVFVFGYRRTFLPSLLDLPILKFFGKKIIFVFHGSDSRPAYLNGALPNFQLSKVYRRTKIIKKELLTVGKYADHIVEAPATTLFYETKVINIFLVGTARKHNIPATTRTNSAITILHSPSNPIAKGTPIIREAIVELKAEGYQFEYIEMINRTNKQVLDAISNADFVIDQLYSDIPMAVFAAEAASYGKPAIIGGYEIDKIKTLLPDQSMPPAYHVQPSKDALKKAIIHLLEDADFRLELGKAAQNFIEHNWTASKVAQRFVQLIHNDVPKEWYLDPYQLDFVYGCCISDEARKILIQQYIEAYGIQALYLSDKPILQKQLLESLN